MNAEQQQIQTAVQQGDYAKAEGLIEQVLQQHPNSAKAHYIHAEVLAHTGKPAQAQQEVAAAKQLDPKIGFTSPEKLGKFEAYLDVAAHAKQQTHTAAQTVAVTPAQPVENQPIGIMPIVIGLLALVLITLLVSRLFRRPAATQNGGYPPGSQGYGGAQNYPVGTNGGTTIINNGSSTGSNVAAGLGGLAAGMMLERALDDRRDEGYREEMLREQDGYRQPLDNREADYAQQQLDDQPFDMGNNDGSWDDSSGPIDDSISNSDSW
ncbi:MAG: tetratricopeptide repeat protein [Paludibacterium sp.]|uniref:tetratricopeptide repeat protein n=1 Tax=Paludibacterium sp. TaxID=1917523 RepID=UPI0025F847E3|nr:tetratricopeptide repeat protein [Paludibacterium sp.]MBV8046156.1 tetratricopeptide repeat protein [Paludibacterium sp.]MBV8648778.1 tetratricopeptide repeat protein [Paludibacterium sp.]